ncbi:serine protease SP24D-like [Anticarsia gemmatalis]|uniref:serine protease SP24D-like n=1 Tax=Anticarsia gemmatalis TaxID=129554 RepID=UPI003F770A23
MYCALALVTLLTAVRETAPARLYNDALRVVNGTDDVHSKYPYVVALKETYPFETFICTGSVIKSNSVLTAAHCIPDDVLYSFMFIQWGNVTIPLKRTKSRRRVVKKIIHPNYKGGKLYLNDIALLIINPVSMNTIGILSAVDYRALLGHSVEYAGYGLRFNPYTEKNRSQLYQKTLGEKLQIGEAVVKSCRLEFDCDLAICLSRKCSTNQVSMHGDSGGPLFLGNKIVGVCSSGDIEDFYEPVSPHLTWIQKHIRGDD